MIGIFLYINFPSSGRHLMSSRENSKRDSLTDPLINCVNLFYSSYCIGTLKDVMQMISLFSDIVEIEE